MAGINQSRHFINLIVAIAFISFNCTSPKKTSCDTLVASGKGFWISFKNFKSEELTDVKIYNKKNRLSMVEKDIKNPAIQDYVYDNNQNFFIRKPVLLSDTIVVETARVQLQVHTFTNVSEEIKSEGKLIDFCRFSTAVVNDLKLPDVGNNILIIDKKAIGKSF
ncbi:MAG TPA: hypothetical protein VGB50_13660 [Flavobacterium sp.]|jgi:uncharacterized UPF0146 family protein